MRIAKGITLQDSERVLSKGYRKQVAQQCVEQGSIVVFVGPGMYSPQQLQVEFG